MKTTLFLGLNANTEARIEIQVSQKRMGLGHEIRPPTVTEYAEICRGLARSIKLDESPGQVSTGSVNTPPPFP